MIAEVLSPVGVPPGGNNHINPRLADLNGKVVGFVDNGKPNFDIYVNRLEELLRGQYELSSVMHAKKGHLGSAKLVTPEQIETLSKSCHAVICGIGD